MKNNNQSVNGVKQVWWRITISQWTSRTWMILSWVGFLLLWFCLNMSVSCYSFWFCVVLVSCYSLWFCLVLVSCYSLWFCLVLISCYSLWFCLVLVSCYCDFVLCWFPVTRYDFVLCWFPVTHSDFVLCWFPVTHYDFVLCWFPVPMILSWAGFLLLWFCLVVSCVSHCDFGSLSSFSVFCRNCFCWNTWRTLLPTFMKLLARRYPPVRHEGCIKPCPSLPPFFASVWQIGASSCE